MNELERALSFIIETLINHNAKKEVNKELKLITKLLSDYDELKKGIKEISDEMMIDVNNEDDIHYSDVLALKELIDNE